MLLELPRLEFPVEREVRHRGERFQLAFASRARDLLGESDDYAVEASGRGLTLLGPDEETLERPIAVLRDTFGAAVEAPPPEVRRACVARGVEPVMYMRVSVARAWHAPVRRCLLARGVELHEDDRVGTRSILRGEGRLVCLLGLPAELAALSGGDAQHWIRLSHYVHRDDGPGGAAA